MFAAYSLADLREQKERRKKKIEQIAPRPLFSTIKRPFQKRNFRFTFAAKSEPVVVREFTSKVRGQHTLLYGTRLITINNKLLRRV